MCLREETSVEITIIQKLFDSISPRYDLFNQIVSLGQHHRWRRTGLQLGKVQSGMKVLDIGMGTGDFSLAAAKVGGPTSIICGIDISEQMLQVASEKLKNTINQRTAMIIPLLAQAEALPIKPNQLDRVISAFTLRNVQDLEVTLKECLKVLKKGGKLIIVEITRPSHSWFLKGYQLYMSMIVPMIGSRLCGQHWPFQYLHQSVMEFKTPKELCWLMEKVGFKNVSAVPLTLGVVHVLLGEKE